MRVAEIMSARVRTIKPNESADAAFERMRVYRTRHLVVEREGRIVGVLSDRDLGGKHGELVRSGRQVSDLMTTKMVVATPKTTIREAANLMRGRVVDCLPVLEGGALKGIVTVLDLLDLLGRGAERPASTAPRAVLKGRGRAPRALAVAKRTSGAKRRGSR